MKNSLSILILAKGMDLTYLILLHSIGCSIRQYFSSIFLKGSLDIYLNQLANLRNFLVPVSLLG